MGAIRYTQEQQRVIDTRDANLLVSAAAGSGKTAVLTQRIISLVTNQEHPVDIDRMLIVTFTKAAAAEMRERIASAIAKALSEEPENAHLQRQSALLHNAQITTIDSFCLFVIRNNFGDINLDPGFRILDEGERKLLQKEILAEMMEDNYALEEKTDFLHLMESYSGNTTTAVEELIRTLFEFAMSHPDPEEWLKNAAIEDSFTDFSMIENTPWWRMKEEENNRLIAYALHLALEGVRLCQDVSGPQGYLPCLMAWYEAIRQLQENEDYEKRYEILHALNIPALSKSVGKEEDKEVRQRVKGYRDRIVKVMDGLIKDCYFDSSDNILIANQEIAINSSELIRLTLDFMQRFREVKRERSVLDFSDMEHFALQILMTWDATGKQTASRAALEYQNYFEYVMVDEYQDSNYVQEFILKSIARDNNYFMVGDVKQSIYRFRLARPEIFMDKYARFGEEGSNIRIDLNQNFRSRKEVIDSVNNVFEQLMHEDTAGMEYDERARLYQGASYPPAQQNEYQTELMLFVKEDGADEDKEEEASEGESLSNLTMEARMVADRIRKMKQQGLLVVDKESGAQRPVCYKDIVILVRATGGYDEEFKKILQEQGIPVYSTVKSGYFQTMEVRTVMNVLKVLDNPLQDIPLYGTLNSYFHQFSEEEIAIIRAGRKERMLYHAMQDYRQLKQDEIAEKIEKFMTWLKTNRARVHYVNIRELIGILLQESGYLEYVSALPRGIQRRANLMMLLEKASDFEATSYHGLFHFVRYITQLKEQEVDYGEAGVLDENADVVRLMTIHKSKGLEFPVCFLCGMTKRLNKKDASKQVLMEMEAGIAMDDINPILRYKRPGFKKRILAKKIIRDGLAEEMRILYVAMTRAKEKLIMTGVIADADKLLDKMPNPGELDSVTILQAVTNLDFVMKSLANAGRLDQYLTFVEEKDLMAFAIEEQLTSIGSREQLRRRDYSVDDSLMQLLSQRMQQNAKYRSLHGLYTKTTVSELKKEAYEDEEAKPMFEDTGREAYVPKFARTNESTSEGTSRGSAYHRVMELLPFARLSQLEPLENQTSQLQSFVRQLIASEQKTGRLSEEYAQLVNVTKLAAFLEHPVARRMMCADQRGQLYKEKAFFLGINANRVNPKFPSEETILVQGVIDVYFEEEDGLVVLDYKTDRVNSKEELVERYHKQLEVYAEALEQITGKRVKEKIIFSFGVNREISL